MANNRFASFGLRASTVRYLPSAIRHLLSAILLFALWACAARTPPAAEAPPVPSPAPAPVEPGPISEPEPPPVMPEELSSAERILGAQIFKLPEPENLEAFFERLESAGINTLFIRAFHNPDDRYHGGVEISKDTPPAGVYFETMHAPVVAPLLAEAARAAKARGFKVFAWMTSRKIPWYFPDKRDLLEYRYDFATHRIERGEGLDVFHPSVEQYLRRLYRDLARAPIDGVLFQDDLVLRHNVGFGPSVEWAFSQKAGGTLRPFLLYRNVRRENGRTQADYTKTFWDWTRLKSERILDLALALREEMRLANPSLSVALNVYYDSVLVPQGGLAWLSQDVEAWAASPIEHFAVMAYHRQMARELDKSFEDTLKALGDMRTRMKAWVDGNAKRILWKIQARDWETREFIPSEKIQEVRRVLDDETAGMVLVPVEEDWEGLDAWEWKLRPPGTAASRSGDSGDAPPPL